MVFGSLLDELAASLRTWCPLNGPLFEVAFYDDTTDDMFTNTTTASYAVAPTSV